MKREPLRVLLIDDDQEDYLITRDLLADIAGRSYHLEWIDDYEAALAAFAQNRHDVYLIDYRFGRHDGLELLHAAAERGCPAPLILQTGQ